MSFVLETRRFFSIFAQDATSGALLPGFALKPSARTRKLITGYQLLFRVRPGGCELYYTLNPLAVDPLLARIQRRERFTFLLEQHEAAFFTRYQPDLTAETGPQLYLDNLTVAGAIQPPDRLLLTSGTVVQPADAAKIVPPVFIATTQMSDGGTPTRFVVRDKYQPAVVLLDVPIQAAAGVAQSSTRIDLSSRPPGPYTLQSDADGAVNRTMYVDGDLAGARVLGVVDIYWETAQTNAAEGGQAYVIRFRRR